MYACRARRARRGWLAAGTDKDALEKDDTSPVHVAALQRQEGTRRLLLKDFF